MNRPKLDDGAHRTYSGETGPDRTVGHSPVVLRPRVYGPTRSGHSVRTTYSEDGDPR